MSRCPVLATGSGSGRGDGAASGPMVVWVEIRFINFEALLTRSLSEFRVMVLFKLRLGPSRRSDSEPASDPTMTLPVLVAP